MLSNPNAEWIAHQITEAFPWNEAPRYVIRDRDRIYDGGRSLRRGLDRRLWLGFELRPPVAEHLEQNPLSLAILSLIQLAMAPRLMVRPPKSLAVPRSRTDDISFST